MSDENKTTPETKREQERSELYRTIWNAANDLVHGGAVAPVDFKQYVLVMLFYRFISENLTNYINANEPDKNFDYATLSNKDAEYGRADTIKEKGFYILPSELFVNVRKNARNNPNLNETLFGVFKSIEGSAKGTDSEDDLKGLFEDFNVNSTQLGRTVEQRNKLLVKLLDTIGDLKLGDYSSNSIDLFGDAYEYLMGMYASAAGKKGGEFYTPQEVSELLAEITTVGKKEVNKVYDPACGSGSLLLKFAKVLGKENVRQGFYGQEINLTTYNLCRINMFLHDINYNNFNIAHGDTLTDPKHWDDEPFDAIVSNPPYSTSWEGDGNSVLINDPRFSPAGVLAPKSKADLAFTMHMLSWLSTTGVAAIVEFPAVLTRKGAEQTIRKYLVDNNYIDAIIQLPKDLFFGTTTDTCIIVLKKSKSDNKILFIDASSEFIRDGIKNKLSSKNRTKILKTYTDRVGIKDFAKVVDNKEISINKYNLSVSSYIKKTVITEKVDIKNISLDISNSIKKQNSSRHDIDQIITELEKLNSSLKRLNDGEVKKKCLSEILDYEQPTPFIVSSTQYSDDYSVPVLTAGKNFILGYTNETHGIYKASKDNPVIIFDDFTTSSHIVDFDFKVKSSAMKMLRAKEGVDVNLSYIYFAMQSITFKPQDHSRHWISKYSLFQIPFPTISTQNEIVMIIQKLNNLNKVLKSEMLLEIEKRNKQYEFYTQKLLNPSKHD